MRSTTAPIARRRGRIAGRLRRKRDADAWHALGLLDRGGCMASWSRPVAVGIFPSRGHRRARAPSDVTFRCPDPWPDDIIRRLSGPSPIAQSVERRTVNPQVPGSSPGRGANPYLPFAIAPTNRVLFDPSLWDLFADSPRPHGLHKRLKGAGASDVIEATPVFRVRERRLCSRHVCIAALATRWEIRDDSRHVIGN